MGNEQSTFDGKRKYLTLEKQERFLLANSKLDRPEIRVFCNNLAHRGCRISEALALHVDSLNLSSRTITIKTLKKGLRLAFGVRMAQKTRSPRLVQKLMGNMKMENTAIYMDLVGEEVHTEVISGW